MKFKRDHPVIVGVVSTLLAAAALLGVLLWQAGPGSSPHGAPAAHRSDSTITPAAHRAVVTSAEPFLQRIAYPAAHADPTQNYADLYLPTVSPAHPRLPLVVLVHGGAWARGVGAHSFDRLARDLTARGLAVYNVEYRRLGSGGGWPATFTDVAAALDDLPAVIRAHPQITLRNSVLAGHSAGAQLAVWSALRTAADPGLGLGPPRWRPSTVISVSGPLDMVFSATHGDSRVIRALGGPPSAVADRYRAVDPLELAADGDEASAPEIVAVHGTADRLVSAVNSERFVAEYLLHRGHGRLQLLPGATHTSMFEAHSAAYRSLIDLIAAEALRP